MRIHFNARHLLYTLPTVFIALVVACGAESQAPKSPAAPTETPASPAAPAVPVVPGGSGTLAVRITDSPFSEASAVLVTFSEVSAHTSDGAWVTLPFAGGAASRTCDLKNLEGAEDVLGTAPLAAGHYTQLRLTVSSAMIYLTPEKATSGPACAASIVVPPGSEVGKPVDVPSGTVKLVHPFDLAGSGTTTILLDFDGDKSIHQTGNGAYKMQPVIKILSVMQ
jgi:hypothetical protein